jgi:hypothetical protein
VTMSVLVGGNPGSAVSVAASNATRSAGQRGSPQRSAPPNALHMKCLQQAGASIDPVTKRWTYYVTERDGMGRTDAFRCTRY